MRPVVSVIVPTRNRPGSLAEALGSVAQQKGLDAGRVEAIVVNDGGVDVTTVVDNARERGLAVTAIGLRRRSGLPAARNAGLDVANGEYVGFLDDDDVYLFDHIRTMLEALDGRNDLVYGECLVADRRVDPAMLGPCPESFDFPFHHGLIDVANTIPVHSAVLRNPRDVGARFDPSLSALEDWDLWLRLRRRHGFRFGHVPAPTVVYHRIPGENSMTGDTGNQMTALAEFGQLVRRVWDRWPTSAPKATRYRSHLGNMYWLALTEFAGRRRPHFNYYLRSMKAIAAAWTGELPEAALINALADAVKEEPDDASAVA